MENIEENNELEQNITRNTNCLNMQANYAPDFSLTTTFGDVSLEDYSNRWLLIFGIGNAFSPVTTTELLSISKHYSEFTKRNCKVLAISCESNCTNLAYCYDIFKSTHIHLPFPIASDITKDFFNSYSMDNSFNSIYLISPDKKLKCIMHYPKEIGRSIPELLRILDSCTYYDEEDALTPANWLPNNFALKKSPTTYDELLESIYTYPNSINWYLCPNILKE